MKYFYVDSTGYVSRVLFGSVSDCLEDIRLSFSLSSFSDSLYFNVYRIGGVLIKSLYIVYRDGVVFDTSSCEYVGDNFVIVNKVKK